MNSVTVIIGSLKAGGAQRVCITLTNALAHRGWRVTLVIVGQVEPAYQARISPLVDVVSMGYRRARSAILALYIHLFRNRPNTVLAFNHELTALIALLKPLLPIRPKLITRCINTLSAKRRAEASVWHKHVVGLLVLWLYRRADRVIAQSEGMRRDLMENYRVPRDHVAVIHNPVSDEFERWARANLCSEGARKGYLLTVASLEKKKALQRAIRAFAAVRHDYPNLRLKLVGDGPERQPLNELAAELGISESVDFEGLQIDVVPYFAHAELTVLTSDYEGFPNVLVESITVGTPVVSINCQSGPSEIVIHDRNGYLTQQDDPDGLVAAIKCALNREWSRASVAATAERFKLPEIVSQYESVLNNA